jgi:hypothetical protein
LKIVWFGAVIELKTKIYLWSERTDRHTYTVHTHAHIKH